MVIPTRNRLRFLRETVPMFLALKEVTEVVVVVDGCDDGTLEHLRGVTAVDPRVRYLDNGVNRGLPYSRNKGINAARCALIYLGEDDLVIPDGFFSTLVAHMEETGADIIAGRNIFSFEHESYAQAIQRADALSGNLVNLRTLQGNWSLGGESDSRQIMLPSPMLVRAAVFRDVRYDESFAGNFHREETDFQFSAQEKGYTLVFCPHAVSLNIEIANDSGGVHAARGIRWVRYCVQNNRRLVRKHRRFLAEKSRIGNPNLFSIRYAADRMLKVVIIPKTISIKRKLVGPRR